MLAGKLMDVAHVVQHTVDHLHTHFLVLTTVRGAVPYVVHHLREPGQELSLCLSYTNSEATYECSLARVKDNTGHFLEPTLVVHFFLAPRSVTLPKCHISDE